MKFILSLLLLTTISFANDELPISEDCVSNCSVECQAQVENFDSLLNSHNRICQGKTPTPNMNHVCAYSCARGCKALMRSMTSIAAAYYVNCGGGNGSYGQLECVKESSRYYVVNSVTGQKYGSSVSFNSQCNELLNTEYAGTFCSKSGTSYRITSKGTGNTYVKSVWWLNECREMVRTGNFDAFCMKEGTNRFYGVDRNSMRKISGKYISLDDCEADFR